MSTGHLLFDRFKSGRHQKRQPRGAVFFGAGNRTRTGTLFTARDFKLLRRCGIHYTGVEFCDRKNMKGII